MLFFRIFQHLLPDATAWNLVADKSLRRFFLGLAAPHEKLRTFVDEVYLDQFADTTRELEEYERAFALSGTGSESVRRQALDAAWKATGGQSPRYLQDIVQAAGFPVYIHDWWDWQIAYASKSQALPGVVDPQDVVIRPDGQKLYAVADNGVIHQFALSTPFDPTTAVSESKTLTLTAQESAPHGFDFLPDGSSLFVVGGNRTVYQYDLSTEWELDTGAYASKSFDVSTLGLFSESVAIGDDGRRLLVLDITTSTAHSFTLATPGEVDTASDDGVSLSFAAQDTGATGIAWSRHGRQLYMLGASNDTVYRYQFDSAWDISTAGYTGVSLDVSVQDAAPAGLSVAHQDDAQSSAECYVVGPLTDSVHQYTVRPTAKDPRQYTTTPLVGTARCGLPDSRCGVQTARCNRFLVNDPKYLVNKNLTLTAPPAIPSNADTWPKFLYWGGETFGQNASVSVDRRDELERLLLKVSPAHVWLVTMIDYFQPEPSDGFAYSFPKSIP